MEVVRRLDISTPPLGLGYLAAVLRTAGFKVRIIDDLVENLTFEKLINKLRDSFLVGITSTTPTFNAALNYAKRIKSVLPNIFVIFGGVHVSFRPFDAIEKDFVDAVCIGEGEKTIVEVAEKIESGKSLEGVKGVIWKKNGKIFQNQPSDFIEDLDSLPYPAYDLMPLDKYTVLGKKLKHFPVISSRGCPFRCSYCSSSAFMGKKFRARSAKNVVDEIEWLYNDFKAKHIAFSDDNFTLSRRRVEEICDEIKRRNLDITWSCSSRVNSVDEEILRKMKDAGCSAIYFGVEAASNRILDYYRKNLKIEEVFKAVKLAKKVGISTICSFIIGAPMETKEEIMDTLKLAIELDPDYAQFSVLTPYPGTEIFELAKKEALLLSENFDDYTAGKPVLKNLHLNSKEIARLLKYCYLRFYIRPKFILRELKKGNISTVFEVLKRFFKK